MRLVASAVVILVAAALCMPASAAAQEPVKSFDQLNTRVRVGDVVWVTDAQGREVNGQIRELYDASLTLDGDGTARYEADRVRLIQRRTKSVGKAALWGAAVGAAVGAVAALALGTEECDCGGPIGAAFITVPIGAGAGALVGAVVRGILPARRRVVYRAPVGGDRPSLSLFPVLGPKVKGLSIAYSF